MEEVVLRLHVWTARWSLLVGSCMECGSNLNAAESGLDKLVQDEKLNYLPVYIFFYYVLLMECGSIAVVFLPLIKSVLEKFTCVYF